jgi:arginine-tRNA-protein transferase
MFLPVEYHFLERQLEHKELDDMLAVGYFRTGNYLLRTRVLLHDEYMHNLFHIRYNLPEYELPKSMRKIYNRNSKLFYHKIKPFRNTKEKEAMFLKHKKRFKSSGSHSLAQFLFDYDSATKFNTYQIDIYDAQTDKLAAYSIFDVGANSIASILGIFDKKYEKYSLGIYSMILEIEHGKNNHFRYYYPSYISDKPSPFNYKIRLGKQPEYYDWFSHTWKTLCNIAEAYTVSDYYTDHANKAETWLKENKIAYTKTRNPHYYMKYYYPKSNCLSSIEQFLILDFSLYNTFFIVEYNALLDKIIVSAVRSHNLEAYFFMNKNEKLQLNDILENNVWKNVMLYVYPNYFIESAQDMIDTLTDIKLNCVLGTAYL